MSASFTAQNITNQLADLWHERIPSDQWVAVRQSTNDIADAFVQKLLDEYARAAAADAWDEGFEAGECDYLQHETFDEPCIKNPYREEQ